ncbi:hypothetical protein GCM10015535_39400 [Streptomyces gelaticus]|uniref:Uncharacterized protein n=1 Tax=Streptomyces gelaticus TaxID=285446 RepID=A0ABQ2W1Q5_9ACTN|nr:hypothetical protein GCM10015535_39400 [Streptomyces gelaticus]
MRMRISGHLAESARWVRSLGEHGVFACGEPFRSSFEEAVDGSSAMTTGAVAVRPEADIRRPQG